LKLVISSAVRELRVVTRAVQGQPVAKKTRLVPNIIIYCQIKTKSVVGEPPLETR